MIKRLILGLILGISLSSLADDKSLLLFEEEKTFDYYFLEAMRLKYQDNRAEAFLMLQKALEIDSTSSSALFEISDYYLHFHQDSLALDALEKAVKNKPDIFEYKLILANQYREQEKTKEPIAIYENLVLEQPENIELYVNLIVLYTHEQMYDKAIESLNALENNTGMNEMVSLQKFNLYTKMGDDEKGIEEIKKLSEKYPFDSRYLFMLGDVYMQSEEKELAREYYEKGHEIDPLSPYYAIFMVGYYESKNETDSINVLFENLMDQHSQEIELNRLYGLFLLSQKRLDEAKFQLQIVTEADPEDYDSWRSLLGIALSEENWEEIKAICSAALVHFPEDSEFYLYKGFALYNEKAYEEALTVFQEGIQYIPSSQRQILSTFYGQTGDIYHQLNQINKAQEAYEKALEYYERNAVVLNNYAYFLSLENRDLDKAERMSAKAVQIETNNATYLDTYAWIFFQQKNYSLAKFYIERSLNTGGAENPEVIEHYGDILFHAGEKERAVQEWERALPLQSNEKRKELLQKKIKDRKFYEL